MAIFGRKEAAPTTALGRLQKGDVTNPSEQQKLIQEVLADESIRTKDVMWALAAARPALRRMGVQVVKRKGGDDLTKALVAEFKNKSEKEQKNLVQSVGEFDATVVAEVLEWLQGSDNRRAEMLLGYLIRQAPFAKIKGALGKLAAEATGDVRVAAISRLREDPQMLRTIGWVPRPSPAWWTTRRMTCAKRVTNWLPP